MAEINIEPRSRRSALPFLIGMLIVAAIAVAVWYFMGRDALGPAGADDTPAATAPPAATQADTSGR